jgi:hypothetical protein
MKLKAIFAALFISASMTQADEIEIVVPENVSEAQGLEAWARMYEVVSHPRCSNCHVGESDRPMWSGPSYGKARVHGMNIRAGESRIGAETLMCSTCHVGSTSGQPHTPPAADGDWRLAPVEAAWFGKGSVEICTQLRNPETNGDRTFEEIAGHLGHDVVLQWAWAPGGNREPAPYSLQEHTNDVLMWGAAGMPCPTE